MSIFLWRLLNDKIPVDLRIQSKGIQLASKCTCYNNIETLNHLFLDGPETSKLWDFFARKFNVILPSTNNITLLLSYWRFSSVGKNHIRTILPMLILWFCWLERNDSKNQGHQFNSNCIIRKVHQFINTISVSKFASLVNWRGHSNIAPTTGFKICVKRRTTLMKVKWNKPDRGWIKINTNGASKGNLGRLVREELLGMRKEWQSLLSMNSLEKQQICTLRYFGLFKALQVYQNENIDRIWIEVDAINLIRLIKEPSKGHWSLQNMLSHINLFLKTVEFKITHIYREGNKAGDHLANFACSTKSSKPYCCWNFTPLLHFCPDSAATFTLLLLLHFATVAAAAAAAFLLCCCYSVLLLLRLCFAAAAAVLLCGSNPMVLTGSLAREGKSFHNCGLVISSVKTNSREEISDHDQNSGTVTLCRQKLLVASTLLDFKFISRLRCFGRCCCWTDFSSGCQQIVGGEPPPDSPPYVGHDPLISLSSSEPRWNHPFLQLTRIIQSFGLGGFGAFTATLCVFSNGLVPSHPGQESSVVPVWACLPRIAGTSIP
ncbi:putative ribonuclease H protein [Sesamum angolense]|uniref:Ribonuclease H protein n=1 Tax=Sesamum angolense TaxID=2727404 RepID=A0AAE1TB23_9LAMI|nr:putative ribonuclease H protein [Sesamum angolense]